MYYCSPHNVHCYYCDHLFVTTQMMTLTMIYCVDIVVAKKTTAAAVVQHDDNYYAKRAEEETMYPPPPSSFSFQLVLLAGDDEDLVWRIVVKKKRMLLRWLDLFDGVLLGISLDYCYIVVAVYIGHLLVPLLDNNVVVGCCPLLGMLMHFF